MPSARAISMMDVHMCGPPIHLRMVFSENRFPLFRTMRYFARCYFARCLFRQMLAEEGEHLAPAVHGLLGPVERPVPIPDAVAGAVAAVEFVHLALPLELG